MPSETYEKTAKCTGIGIECLVIVSRECIRNILGIRSSHCESLVIVIVIVDGGNGLRRRAIKKLKYYGIVYCLTWEAFRTSVIFKI